MHIFTTKFTENDNAGHIEYPLREFFEAEGFIAAIQRMQSQTKESQDESTLVKGQLC